MGLRRKRQLYLLSLLQCRVAYVAGYRLLRGSNLARDFCPIHLNESRTQGAVSVRRVCAGTAVPEDVQAAWAFRQQDGFTPESSTDPRTWESGIVQVASMLFSWLSRTPNKQRVYFPQT